MQAPRIDAQTLPPPPGIIGSLRSGFDAIAGHVGIILLPLALDLLLWLGPHVGITNLVQPFLKDWASMPNTAGVKIEDVQSFLQAFNVLGILRTFPIGIPSLMSGVMPTETPWGAPKVVQLASVPQFFGLALLLTFAGWVLGALYFRWVSVAAAPSLTMDEHAKPTRAISQTILYSLIWTIVSWVILIPVSILLSILFMINAVLGEGVLLLLGFLSMWLVVPLFFSPHGIFVRKHNALASFTNGFQLTRFTLPTSSLFALIVFLLGAGLNSLLWSRAAADTWMVLVGILGHAFVTTALLASSFVYYHNMSAWLQVALARLRAGMPGQQI
jgi:hypothetical protein